MAPTRHEVTDGDRLLVVSGEAALVIQIGSPRVAQRIDLAPLARLLAPPTRAALSDPQRDTLLQRAGTVRALSDAPDDFFAELAIDPAAVRALRKAAPQLPTHLVVKSVGAARRSRSWLRPARPIAVQGARRERTLARIVEEDRGVPCPRPSWLRPELPEDLVGDLVRTSDLQLPLVAGCGGAEVDGAAGGAEALAEPEGAALADAAAATPASFSLAWKQRSSRMGSLSTRTTQALSRVHVVLPVLSRQSFQPALVKHGVSFSRRSMMSPNGSSFFRSLVHVKTHSSDVDASRQLPTVGTLTRVTVVPEGRVHWSEAK